MTRVLLAEDDPAISEPLARALRREGYDVDVREDGLAALDGAKENPDLVLLDLGLPKIDGLEVCRRIRAEGRAIPVLILTARADEVDTVVGLDAGADDYVTKPFRLAELLARVRALLRRTPTEVVRSRRHTSSPSIFGSITSSTTRSTDVSENRCSASSPSRADTTRYPSRSSGYVSSFWIDSSSSTSRMVASAAIAKS